MDLKSCGETIEEDTRKFEVLCDYNEENKRIEEFLEGIHFIDGYYIVEESAVTGHVFDEEAFLNQVDKLGYSFSKLKTNSEKGRLRIRNNGILPQDMKYAFKSCSINYYACSHGTLRYNAKRRDEDQYKKKRFRLCDTNDIRCTAKMQIQKLVYYPQYEMPSNYNTRSVRKVMKELKEDDNPQEERIFRVQIDLPQTHNHPTETSLIDSGVVRKIRYCKNHPIETSNLINQLTRPALLHEIRKVCKSIMDKTYLISHVSFERSNEVIEKLEELNEVLSKNIKEEDGINLLPEEYLDFPIIKKRKCGI